MFLFEQSLEMVQQQNSNNTVIECLGFFSVPPTLHLDPSNQKIVVRSGTTVALRCKASGNPSPKIIWRKRNDRLPVGEITDGGTTFSMSDVNW
jgi:hypothetical protein